ncbi:MAG: phosphate ABC transporter substrate-binding protein [Herbiconiux sp.]|uniref:substrate-binding domain-containing protein n=1 Tax=Herbiconiux sp. TaxID=1871186 RepID=UPI0012266462|nr:substrate-binding domain-containing protein [Herbiconiux sp.]TAJ48552.1 MAG: phosphate ABC transporter substrate-binding protein [Herbiconiux sp.]
MENRRRRPVRAALALACALVAGAALLVPPVAPSASAATTVPITGLGSTWMQNAVDFWRRDLVDSTGQVVNYAGIGASGGRAGFGKGQSDFALTELPYAAPGSVQDSSGRPFTYVPAVAGGTVLAYNLRDAAHSRIVGLRLSEATVAGIFTGSIRAWNDPAIAAENPDVALPATPVVPVVRRDVSGSSYAFASWLAARQPAAWARLCAAADCSDRALFPVLPHMQAQYGSLGVAGYVAQGYGEGSITYVENSFAIGNELSTAKLLNMAGYYTAATPEAVGIALSAARIDQDPASPTYRAVRYEGVWDSRDPRAYPLSSVGLMVVPTSVDAGFTTERGAALAAFGSYALCQGQARAPQLGYAPLPVDLVTSGLSQLGRVPGGSPVGIDDCRNPAFTAGDTATDSLLTRTAPMPSESDRVSAGICEPGVADSPDSSVTTLCAATIVAPETPLSLELPVGAAAAFASPTLVDGQSLTIGTLPEITVRDGRVSAEPGWDLVATIADFENADRSATIPSLYAGLQPAVVGALHEGISAGPGESAGGAVYPTLFGMAEAGSGAGDTVLGGMVSLLAPRGRPAGTYTSTMTLTLISR